MFFLTQKSLFNRFVTYSQLHVVKKGVIKGRVSTEGFIISMRLRGPERPIGDPTETQQESYAAICNIVKYSWYLSHLNVNMQVFEKSCEKM